MLISFLLHVVLIVLVILLPPGPVKLVRAPEKNKTKPNRIFLSPVPSPSKGGGGTESKTPPGRGPLPRFARCQFVPPMIVPATATPKLTAEPTIILAAAMSQTLSNARFGLPNGLSGLPSGGPGRLGGIGDGTGGGIGNSSGPGAEGVAAEPLRAGMQPPVAIYKFEPEYSEQARKARVQGTVVLEGIIDEKGKTHALRVVDGLGFGLDEQAIDAVRQWRFRPATRAGKPLAIIGTFYLTFRLL
jgi:TonB family protein